MVIALRVGKHSVIQVFSLTRVESYLLVIGIGGNKFEVWIEVAFAPGQ